MPISLISGKETGGMTKNSIALPFLSGYMTNSSESQMISSLFSSRNCFFL
ncbi:MAG: hypothetical protein A4E31_00931 [Methanomassiliicoccales archaeon PtaU1.Bin030]|nr:MAG: hypothetical protein A4E31_00931 [Methanomassiliicoccales archaeon PtaU1.Bin030]